MKVYIIRSETIGPYESIHSIYSSLEAAEKNLPKSDELTSYDIDGPFEVKE